MRQLSFNFSLWALVVLAAACSTTEYEPDGTLNDAELDIIGNAIVDFLPYPPGGTIFPPFGFLADDLDGDKLACLVYRAPTHGLVAVFGELTSSGFRVREVNGGAINICKSIGLTLRNPSTGEVL